MSSHGDRLGTRLAAWGAALILAFALVGDRGRAATVPAPVYGQDPLEVLELKVRPNVMIVLDTSGSMKWGVKAPSGPSNNYYPPMGGDHPRSKVWQARNVLNQIVQDNQDQVSFLFAQYEQTNANIVMQNRTASTSATQDANRFMYSTYSCTGACPQTVADAMANAPRNNGLLESSTMTSTELTIANDAGGSGGRGLQSWQMIDTNWSKLYFQENGGPTCTATIPGTLPKFYPKGGNAAPPATASTPANLAYDLQVAMNAASCTGAKANTYSVSYDGATGRFSFWAAGPKTFRLGTGAQQINGALGSLDTVTWATASVAGGSVTLVFTTASTPALTAVQKGTSANGGTRITTSAAHGVVVGDTCSITGASPATINTGAVAVTAVTATRITMNPPRLASGATVVAAPLSAVTVTCTRATAAVAGTSVRSTTPYTLLYRASTAASINADFDSVWTGVTYKNSETVGSTATTIYTARAQRFFNGEVIRVQSDGQICGMTFPTAAERTNPPSFTVQQVNPSCGTDVANATATFRWGGAYYVDQAGGSYCNGMVNRVQLVPCDLRAPAPTQLATIAPWLANEFPLDATGMPDPAPIDLVTKTATTGYTEAQDGTWTTLTYPPFMAGGVKGYGATPIAASITDIDTLFTNLWTTGQPGAAVMAGPPPYQISAISTHTNPKEKTILLFVTDGADTCAGSGDGAALTAANAAKNLYLPVVNSCKDPGDSITSTPPCADANSNGVSGFSEPASSVQTFMIGYGDGVNSVADVNRLNWISWGGSGVNKDFPGQDTGNNTTTNTNLKAFRDSCSTCRDAFIAPDAATLRTQLQGIINQGAQDGDFNAQQSVTDTVFEYVNRADATKYDARNVKLRYRALVPTQFTSSFSLPGFNGQLRAYQNDGAGNALLMWSAGDKLRTLVTNGMAACNTAAQGGAIGECSFALLHAGATDASIATSSAAIKRRVYTTTRNGVYTYTAADLMNATWGPPERTTLWPPANGVTPASFTSQGSLDAAFGLPLDTSTTLAADFTALQTGFRACLGTNLPAGCASATPLTKMQAARREAREILLAFMMGAEPALGGTSIKRGSSGAALNQILYKARSWVLADSELATVAVATAPLPAEPKAYVEEYQLLTKGPRSAAGKNTDAAGLQLKQGFGLRTPDDDNTAGSGPLAIDTRAALKPVMTVVYAPANDMLHAFRAGPCYSPSTTPSACLGGAAAEGGGEELWGFVPFDMLHAIRLRAANQPQTRNNHVYMLARGMRLTDVFVPGPMTSVNIGGITVPSMRGVWRRVIWLGRGIGGKYLTALDVTGIGAYTTAALNTRAPNPLWSRGNPDTQSGLASDTNLNGTTTSRDRYKKMGETWSVPVVGWVDSSNPIYATPRRPAGVDFPLFMGSGYGDTSGCPADPCEGKTFFTLDSLSGDVIASVDVEQAAAGFGLTRSNPAVAQATLVANPAGFQPLLFQELKTVHPAATYLERVYIADTHGRVWKFLTAAPDVAIPFADLGQDQPVGTAVALNGLPPYNETTGTNPVPYVHVTSGNDSRATGPFKIFAFRDDGDKVSTATGSSVTANQVTSFPPSVSLYTRTFDPGTPQANCGYTEEALFRGTVQPMTTYGEGTGATTRGVVVYGGTRLSLPNTKFAPVTPLACGQGSYPCRSQFDSIVYVLGTETGQAAYDLNAAGDDAYRVFRDSRLVAISMQADPDPARGGSRLNLDEGLVRTVPKPPPPPGVPPTATTATANVLFKREAGQPAPTVHYGATVCQ